MGFTITWNTRIPEASSIRKTYRQDIAVGIRDAIRIRVRDKGSGPDGVLRGYSTTPLVVEPGTLKPKRKPVRGWYAFHGGGYKQYRQELGLVSELFVFSNRGTAWKDWRFFPIEERGPIAFGFAASANSQAADEAVRRGREDMFAPGDPEMNQAADQLLNTILDKVFG